MSWQDEGNIKGPQGISGAITDQGVMPLAVGQDFVEVILNLVNDDDNWLFVERSIVNTVDPNPLNIFGGLLTSKTDRSFRMQLSGKPDTANYFLRWAVNGLTVPITPAVTYQLLGPASGNVGEPSTFTVKLLPSTTLPAPVTVTPSAGLDISGTFVPTQVTLSDASPSVTFAYTPASAGPKTISVANDGGLTDPSPLSFEAVLSAHLRNLLTSYWKCDDAGNVSGPSTWLDSMGTNNLPATNVPSVPGKLNGAAGFDKVVLRYLQLASNPSLQVTGDFTWSFWIEPANNADFMLFLGKNDGVNDDYSFYYSGTSAPLGFTFACGGTSAVSGAAVTPSTWHHILGWYDHTDKKLRLRVDLGTPFVSPASATLIQTAALFTIGMRGDGVLPFSGGGDEIGFWPRLLSVGEQITLYGGGTPPPFSSFTL